MNAEPERLVAGVDLGSNSFHMIVARREADGRVHVLDRLRESVRLASGLDEQRRLVADLGNHVAMLLRNHGLLAVGATIPEAFVTIYWLERACQAQAMAMAMAMASSTELHFPQSETVLKTNQRYKPGQRRKIGELEWAGLLRLLERKYPGFRD